ncbi:hypothetical protein TNCT_349391 [Trichonephila clavata]|uniref:Uncharacterized protein n=1 Tax=Trichonephila clavata TaxID=2740835 RepID=A0A8X6GJQ5_TRICU|nr:hypothetical protein TNCT_349391 [Trichonephila clavata]
MEKRTRERKNVFVVYRFGCFADWGREEGVQIFGKVFSRPMIGGLPPLGGRGARRSEIRQESVDATCYELSHLGDVIIPRCETKSTQEGKETMLDRACASDQFVAKTRSCEAVFA